MIEVHGVSKQFRSKRGTTKRVLEHIELRLQSGQTHVLLGLSGCGKSTLLRILMGLTWPDTGEVTLDGTRLTPQNQRSVVRGMGYVIQEGGLFPHLTAEENVALVAKMLGREAGWDAARIQNRLKELATLVGFEPTVLKRFPKELSGGQRQRVGLMRALMLDPPILLLDEPLGALDPIVRSALRNELKEIFNRLKKTVLLVTHDLDEASLFGDTITLMKDGHIEQHGSLDDFVHNPASAFVTEFINAQRPSQDLRQLL